MSGGSLDYVYSRVQEAAERIKGDDRPLYRAFGDHLLAVAAALHAVEWEYSADYGRGDAVPFLNTVLGDAAKPRELEEILRDIRAAAESLKAALDLSSGQRLEGK